MDTVAKSLLEEDPSEDKGLIIFGRDVSKIPCFKESYFYGILSGIGVGLAAFMKTSKPRLSSHIGMASFCTVTLGYYTYCRSIWSQQLKDAELMHIALKDKMKYEGTAVEKQLEEVGVLKTV